MEDKIIVYDVEHNGVSFVTDDVGEVIEALVEIANDLNAGDGYSEFVKIEVSHMLKIEFDAMEDFEEEV